MADIPKNNVTFVVCTKCEQKIVVFNKNRPPKYCSECGNELPPPININQNTEAVNKSLQRVKKPYSEKVFGNIKPTSGHDIPLEQCDSTRPPSEMPIEESHETRSGKHDDKSFSERSDDGKPPRKKFRDYESPSEGSHGNIPLDDKPFNDKPVGTNLNDKSSTDKSSSDEKPAHKPLSDKPCGDTSSGDRHDANQLVCDNKFL